MKAKTAQPITQPSSNTVRDYNMLLIKAVWNRMNVIVNTYLLAKLIKNIIIKYTLKRFALWSTITYILIYFNALIWTWFKSGTVSVPSIEMIEASLNPYSLYLAFTSWIYYMYQDILFYLFKKLPDLIDWSYQDESFKDIITDIFNKNKHHPTAPSIELPDSSPHSGKDGPGGDVVISKIKNMSQDINQVADDLDSSNKWFIIGTTLLLLTGVGLVYYWYWSSTGDTGGNIPPTSDIIPSTKSAAKGIVVDTVASTSNIIPNHFVEDASTTPLVNLTN
jgi:hypothetical protein